MRTSTFLSTTEPADTVPVKRSLVRASVPLGLGLLFLGWIISGSLYVRADGALVTDYSNVWGDWSLHVAHAWWFAEQPIERWLSPPLLFYEQPTVYPPLINFFSGMMLRAGFGLQAAMVLPALVAGVSLFVAVYILFFRYVRSSWAASGLAGLLFLAGGTRTIGFLLAKLLEPGSTLAARMMAAMEQLPSSVVGEQIASGPLNQVWLVPLYGLFLPQRTLLAGMAVGIVALIGLLRFHDTISDQEKHRVSRPSWWFCFFLLMYPMLSLAHFHSLIVVAGMAFAIPLSHLVAVRAGWSQIQRHLVFWFRTVGPGLILGLLILTSFLVRSSAHVGGFAFEPGWMSQSVGQNLTVFWLINWGIFLPMVVVAALTSRDFRYDPLFISALFLFAVANIMRLHPWAWDNSKVLIWTMLLSGLPMSRFIAKTGRSWLIVVLPLLIGLDGLLATGYRLIKKSDPIVLWTSEEQVIADWTRKNISRDALILSPSFIDHKFWSYALTGRSNVLAYSGWLWSHGIAVEPMMSRLKIMLKNPGLNLGSIQSMGISHIAVPELIGPVEIGFGELKGDFNLVFSFENQALFSVPPNLQIKPLRPRNQ